MGIQKETNKNVLKKFFLKESFYIYLSALIVKVKASLLSSPDDDECVASRPCPYSATCTNTPGDFYCTCKPGYTQTGKTSCQGSCIFTVFVIFIITLPLSYTDLSLLLRYKVGFQKYNFVSFSLIP